MMRNVSPVKNAWKYAKRVLILSIKSIFFTGINVISVCGA